MLVLIEAPKGMPFDVLVALGRVFTASISALSQNGGSLGAFLIVQKTAWHGMIQLPAFLPVRTPMAAYPDLISEAIAMICTARDHLSSDDPRRQHCRAALTALSASINEMLYPTDEYGEIVIDYETEFWKDMGL